LILRSSDGERDALDERVDVGDLAAGGYDSFPRLVNDVVRRAVLVPNYDRLRLIDGECTGEEGQGGEEETEGSHDDGVGRVLLESFVDLKSGTGWFGIV
jgi:hypothetical protein